MFWNLGTAIKITALTLPNDASQSNLLNNLKTRIPIRLRVPDHLRTSSYDDMVSWLSCVLAAQSMQGRVRRVTENGDRKSETNCRNQFFHHYCYSREKRFPKATPK